MLSSRLVRHAGVFKSVLELLLIHSLLTPHLQNSVLQYVGTVSLIDLFDVDLFDLLNLFARTGDVRSFNALMERWERVFITNGTYLLMEKCLMLVYRNLVKKM